MKMKHFLRATVAMLGLAVAVEARAQTCHSDLNGDGQVNGTDLSILLAEWGLCPATISSVTPPHGGIQGGTDISIMGTGLATTISVKVGGVACTNLKVLTPTTVRATTPPGAVGEASIAVTTAAGTTLASTPFTYVLQQVTSIVPNAGPYAGGTPIMINGQFLSNATAVTVGGVPCTNVVSLSSTQVTAVTPAGSVGAVDVVVTCEKGTVTVPGGFSYLSVIVPGWATLIEALPDPEVVTDPALRAAIAATGRAWRIRDTAMQVEMLLVPPGSFQMGCVASVQFACLGDENPVHMVTVSHAFYLGRFEVTQAQWSARTGSNPSQFQGMPDSANRPVERVTWSAAHDFAAGAGMRLPTEAEWEYACRAGTTTAFSNGSSDDGTIGGCCWFIGNSRSGGPRPVGLKRANPLGFHDMHGNVWEWVNDWYLAGYYSLSPQVDPLGPASGGNRCTRGGSWMNDSSYARSSTRGFNSPGTISGDYGFRVARNP